MWDYLRQSKLCALVWPTYEDILDACQSICCFRINDPDRIRSIGTRKWACVSWRMALARRSDYSIRQVPKRGQPARPDCQ
jgi:hypothetical protein